MWLRVNRVNRSTLGMINALLLREYWDILLKNITFRGEWNGMITVKDFVNRSKGNS